MRTMVQHGAVGVWRTGAVTWILAFVANAGQRGRTIGVHGAFGTAVWRAAHVVGQTGADCVKVLRLAHGIWSAWRWMAWIDRGAFDHWINWNGCDWEGGLNGVRWGEIDARGMAGKWIGRCLNFIWGHFSASKKFNKLDFGTILAPNKKRFQQTKNSILTKSSISLSTKS